MKAVQTSIKDFLSQNKISTVCFVDQELKPYCINCFYVYDEESNALVFKSSYGTKHDVLVKPGAAVAGTVVPESVSVLSLKGIQFSGQLMDPKEMDQYKLSSRYVKEFPMSLALPGYVWAVKLSFLKYTDNTLGFGNKTIWEAAETK